MDVERVELAPGRLIGVHEVVAMAELTEFFGRAFQAAATGMARHGVTPSGPAVALYTGAVTEKVDVTAGFLAPDPERHYGHDGGLVEVHLPEGPAVVTMHTGPYDAMAGTYAELEQWMRAHGVTPRDVMWEEYLDGPDSEPDPARWRTRIVFPVA